MTLQQVQETIEKYHMLSGIDKVIVGLSGGADSVVLLDVLTKLSVSMGFQVEAIHINHQLRAKANEETDFCRSLCSAYGVACHVHFVDVAAYARMNKCSLEEAGRQVRYGLFEEVVDGHTRVALGHHMNDRVETVVFNLMRGTGLSGLTGISPVRDAYIRPLIHIGKAEIYDYAMQNELKFYEDESNLETDFTRNHIRHQLLPYMATHYNPKVATAIHQTALSLEEDNDCLCALAADIYQEIRSDNGLVIDALQKQPVAIRKRLYRLALMEVMTGFKDIGYVHYEAIEQLLTNQSGKHLELPHQVRVARVFDQLVFYKPTVEMDQSLERTLADDISQITNETTVVETLEGVYRLSICHWSEVVESDSVIYVDAGAIKQPIIQRFRRDGDRIYLKQLQGHKKLKKYLIEQKIPATIRNRVPIISCGNDILWVVGYLKSNLYEVNKDTEAILKIQWSSRS